MKQRIAFYFTPVDDKWKLFFVAESSKPLHKGLATKLQTVVMMFSGGEVVAYRDPGRINTPLYQWTNALTGLLIVPSWCHFGHLVYNTEGR